MRSGNGLNINITDGRPADLKSLLALTNKYYNLEPGKTRNAPAIEKKKAPEAHKARASAVKRRLKAHIDPGDIRTVTKISPFSRPDSASFEKKRMGFWEKISAVFSSKKKDTRKC